MAAIRARASGMRRSLMPSPRRRTNPSRAIQLRRPWRPTLPDPTRYRTAGCLVLHQDRLRNRSKHILLPLPLTTTTPSDRHPVLLLGPVDSQALHLRQGILLLPLRYLRPVCSSMGARPAHPIHPTSTEYRRLTARPYRTKYRHTHCHRQRAPPLLTLLLLRGNTLRRSIPPRVSRSSTRANCSSTTLATIARNAVSRVWSTCCLPVKKALLAR